MTGRVFSRATPGEVYKLRLQGDAVGLAELLATPEAAQSPKLRRDIAFALSCTHATPALPALRELATNDPDERVRLHAVAAIATTGDRESVPVFESALAERNANICEHAISGLERAGTREAVAVLIRALSHRKVSVRSSAAGALARLGDPAAVEPLQAAIKRTWRPFARTYMRSRLEKLQART